MAHEIQFGDVEMGDFEINEEMQLLEIAAGRPEEAAGRPEEAAGNAVRVQAAVNVAARPNAALAPNAAAQPNRAPAPNRAAAQQNRAPRPNAAPGMQNNEGLDIAAEQPRRAYRGTRAGHRHRRPNPYERGIRNVALLLASLASASTTEVFNQIHQSRYDEENDRQPRDGE